VELNSSRKAKMGQTFEKVGHWHRTNNKTKRSGE